MASSKVMPSSSSSANLDLGPVGRRSSSAAVHPLVPGKSFGSMNMDDLLRNIYTDHPATEIQIFPRGESKTVEEVWKEITAAGDGDAKMEAGGGGQVVEGLIFKDHSSYEGITLEDFLAKAGAAGEEDARVSPETGPSFPVDPSLIFQNNNSSSTSIINQFRHQQVESVLRGGLGNGNEAGGRGKRRPVQEPMDRVAQQRQRRMIKNRESAARSREKKQAYTSELEALVTQLEEENARLVMQQNEQKKKRLKQLMETLVPVEEKRRPPRMLRKTQSMDW